VTRRRPLVVAIAAVLVGAALLLALAEPASACTVCFGDPNSAETRGLRGAIVFLLVLVGLVQVGFLRLFWVFRRRAKSLDDRKKQLRILRGGVRS
jgi:hypothetical protein